MWDNSLFGEAFDVAGLRSEVALIKAGGSIIFRARFEQPQHIMADDQVHTTHYWIEYESAKAPALSIDDVVLINGASYRVVQPPRAQGDGYFVIADLEKV